jgi:hypothetical protein
LSRHVFNRRARHTEWRPHRFVRPPSECSKLWIYAKCRHAAAQKSTWCAINQLKPMAVLLICSYRRTMTSAEIKNVAIPHLVGQFERELPILFTGSGFSD